MINGGQGGSHSYHGPFKGEQPPAQCRVGRADGGQGNHGVGACDEEIDGAVVNDLHNFFAHGGLQAVIHAGNGKHGDHTGAVNCGGDDAVHVAVEGGKDDTQGQGHHAHRTAHNVGHHIHDLFAPGVIRKHAVR